MDERAGSHPFALTTTLDLNQGLAPSAQTVTHKGGTAPQLLKDLQLKLPPGLIGNANPGAIPQCSDHDFSTIRFDGATNACPEDTAIGVAVVNINEPHALGEKTRAVPVFDLVPAPGEPARLGFEVVKDLVVLDTAVESGGDYSVVTSVRSASQVAEVLGSAVTIWGEPGNPIHDQSRGWGCLVGGRSTQIETCAPPEQRAKPFLTMPTACNEPLKSFLQIDSWAEPGVTRTPEPGENPSTDPPLKGCESLRSTPPLNRSRRKPEQATRPPA